MSPLRRFELCAGTPRRPSTVRPRIGGRRDVREYSLWTTGVRTEPKMSKASRGMRVSGLRHPVRRRCRGRPRRHHAHARARRPRGRVLGHRTAACARSSSPSCSPDSCCTRPTSPALLGLHGRRRHLGTRGCEAAHPAAARPAAARRVRHHRVHVAVVVLLLAGTTPGRPHRLAAPAPGCIGAVPDKPLEQGVPVGMHAVATTQLGHATDVPWLVAFGHTETWVAATLWLTVVLAMIHSIAGIGHQDRTPRGQQTQRS
ncbi:hypothetical protein Actkin_02120 [Actinokineospora sp. UTMC 2448]|nr:hypothetical protein Actkin_02120 [Actinokineospora sp. UTMC 2448]